MCIADYLGKGYLPLIFLHIKNEVNELVSDSNFCKEISPRAKYCYRDVSLVTLSDDFEPNSII